MKRRTFFMTLLGVPGFAKLLPALDEPKTFQMGEWDEPVFVDMCPQKWIKIDDHNFIDPKGLQFHHPLKPTCWIDVDMDPKEITVKDV